MFCLRVYLHFFNLFFRVYCKCNVSFIPDSFHLIHISLNRGMSKRMQIKE
jgi:hypothetical protein